MSNEENEGRAAPRHPIRVVARRTGLTPTLLRAWERRYGAVVPARSDGGRRLYSDNDVARLTLLHQAVEGGRAISQVAALSKEELQALVEEDQLEGRGPVVTESLAEASAARVLERAQRAVREMNPTELERILKVGALAFPGPLVTDEIVVPLLSSIGTAWASGRMGPRHEHVATVVVRGFLEWVLGTGTAGTGAPVLVAATPAGERHELGALLSAVSAAAEGWRAVFLGPDLPADEIVSAAIGLEAEVLALSCVDGRIAETLTNEVRQIRRALPAAIRLLLGGPVAVAEEGALGAEGVQVLGNLSELRASLRRTRSVNGSTHSPLDG